MTLTNATTTNNALTLTWDQTNTSDSNFQCYRILRSTTSGYTNISPLLGISGSIPALGSTGVTLLALFLLALAFRRYRKSAGAAFLLFLLLVSYQQTYSEVTDPYLTDCISGKTTLSKTLVGMDANTTYYFKVYVMGTDGSYEASNEISVKTGAIGNYASSLATNIWSMSYSFNSDWLVVDQYAKSSQWYPYSTSAGGWNKGTISSSDSNGWPTGITGDTTLYQEMFRSIDGHYPIGTYVLHWEGSGGLVYVQVENASANFRCDDGNAITSSATFSSCSTKRAYFDVTTTGDYGISLQIFPDSAATYSSSNYIKNIRVIMPGGVCGRSSTDLDYTEYCQTSRGGEGACDSGETCYDFDDVHWNRFSDPVSEMHNPKVVFHPKSLKNLEKYRALRMMNQQEIQGSPVINWSSGSLLEHRALVTQYTLGLTNGSPPEYQIALANVLHADPWFNMPHLASDDYVTQFSNMAITNLDSSLNLYVEYTNEHYNTDASFTQSDYMLSQANALGLGSGQSDHTKMNLYYAQRSIEIFDLWHTAFGSSSGRVKRVLGGFIAMPSTSTNMLEHTHSTSGIKVSTKVDAVAIGCYFGGYLGYPEFENTVQGWSVDQLFNEMSNGGVATGVSGFENSVKGALSELYAYIDAHTTVAASYGVDLVAYEWGQHLLGRDAVANNATIQTLFENANRDPRMAAYYSQLLNYWKNTGGKISFHFAHVQPYRLLNTGVFGSMEYTDSTRTNSVKYDALMDFIESTPCWWSGCS